MSISVEYGRRKEAPTPTEYREHLGSPVTLAAANYQDITVLKERDRCFVVLFIEWREESRRHLGEQGSRIQRQCKQYEDCERPSS